MLIIQHKKQLFNSLFSSFDGCRSVKSNFKIQLTFFPTFTTPFRSQFHYLQIFFALNSKLLKNFTIFALQINF